MDIKKCPYNPCSKYGTNCTYCFCPFYNNFCFDTRTGGKFIETKNGYKLWDCTDCRYIHRDYVVKLLNLDINERRRRRLKLKWEQIRGLLNNQSTRK